MSDQMIYKLLGDKCNDLDTWKAFYSTCVKKLQGLEDLHNLDELGKLSDIFSNAYKVIPSREMRDQVALHLCELNFCHVTACLMKALINKGALNPEIVFITKNLFAIHWNFSDRREHYCSHCCTEPLLVEVIIHYVTYQLYPDEEGGITIEAALLNNVLATLSNIVRQPTLENYFVFDPMKQSLLRLAKTSTTIEIRYNAATILAYLLTSDEAEDNVLLEVAENLQILVSILPEAFQDGTETASFPGMNHGFALHAVELLEDLTAYIRSGSMSRYFLEQCSGLDIIQEFTTPLKPQYLSTWISVLQHLLSNDANKQIILQQFDLKQFLEELREKLSTTEGEWEETLQNVERCLDQCHPNDQKPSENLKITTLFIRTDESTIQVIYDKLREENITYWTEEAPNDMEEASLEKCKIETAVEFPARVEVPLEMKDRPNTSHPIELLHFQNWSESEVADWLAQPGVDLAHLEKNLTGITGDLLAELRLLLFSDAKIVHKTLKDFHVSTVDILKFCVALRKLGEEVSSVETNQCDLD